MLAAKRPTQEELPSLYAELKKVPDPHDKQGPAPSFACNADVTSVDLLCNY